MKESPEAIETRGESPAERFCSKYAFRVPVGNNLTLVYWAPDRSASVVHPHIAALLEQCRTFKTLDEHALQIGRIFARREGEAKAPTVDSIREHLASLANSGMLLSEKRILAACSRGSYAAPPKIGSVGVITRNRTQNLERCLRSYLDNCRHYGRTNDFVVMDDSEDPGTRSANKQLLSQLKAEYGGEISYAGREEKMLFTHSLIREGSFDPDLVNFALIDSGGHEFSCGKNRNALFLHTIGDLVFSTDDDAICKIVAPPQSPDHAEQTLRGQPQAPMEFWFFPNREDAINSQPFLEEDLFVSHEKLLGRRIADCLARFGDMDILSADRPLSHQLRALETTEGRVLVTLTGMLGDSGLRVPPTYKVLTRASRQRLIQSRETYLAAGSSREVMRVSTRYCLSSMTWFISTALGYDNRDLLPPFFPVLRGTDGVFAATLARCHEYGYLGDIPRAVLHAPTRSRSYRPDDVINSAGGITMHSLMVACILSRQFWSGLTDSAQRMRAIGSHLVEIGSLKLGDFDEFARAHVWRDLSATITNLERDLMDYQS